MILCVIKINDAGSVSAAAKTKISFVSFHFEVSCFVFEDPPRQ